MRPVLQKKKELSLKRLPEFIDCSHSYHHGLLNPESWAEELDGPANWHSFVLECGMMTQWMGCLVLPCFVEVQTVASMNTTAATPLR